MKEEAKFFNDNNDQPQRKITEWFYRKNSKGNERLYQKKITLLKENGEIKDSAIFDKNGNKITTFIEPSLNPDKSSAHHLLDNQGVAVSNANANTVIEDLIAPLSLRDKNMTLILFDLLKAFMQNQPDDIKVSFGKYLMKLLEPSANKAPVVKKEPHQDNAQAEAESRAAANVAAKESQVPSSVAESINQQSDHTRSIRSVRSVSGQAIQALQKNLLIQSSPLFQLMTSNIEIMSEIIEPLLNRNSACANQSLEEAMSSFSGNYSVEAISIPINHTKQIEETNIVKLPAVTATM
ncbi:hypothetical protein [Candidatus Hamiltonella defensa]|nr:hypothetical protein [Candidatus Hamiltonella defensa]